MTDEREKPTPALFDWACRVWKAMQATATPREVEGLESPTLVYEGHLTNLFRSLEVPNPYYTSVMKALKNQGCALQLRRGGGSALSQWALIKEPQEETFREATERASYRRGKVGVLEQRVNDLQRLVNGLLDRIERIEEEHATGRNAH